MTFQNGERRDGAIVVELIGSVAIVWINRAKYRNSLSMETLEELDTTVSSLIQNKQIDALIFSGTKDVFASGADINELASMSTLSARRFAYLGQNVFNKIANTAQTTVAAINGYCFGGGLDLALSCDLRCASVNAVFAHPGAGLGIITGWGGTQRLPGIIGKARALEMFTTARRLSSKEAYQMGLVNRLGDPVIDLALEIVGQRNTH
jgi:enoyl-CoA hydratase